MPVTARSLRRNRHHAASTRATAAVLASIVGAAGAAWGVATMFEPFRENFAKSSDRPAETTGAPMDPVLLSQPTMAAPAEDLAAGSPSAWRSESNLLRVADSLNTAVTPTSGGGSETGGTNDGGSNDGGGKFWVAPPGLDFGGDDGESGLDRPDWDPGRDATMLECVAASLDTLPAPSTGSGLERLEDAGDTQDEAPLSPRCDEPADDAEQAAPAESEGGEQPAEEGSEESGTGGDGGDPSTSVE